MTHNLSISILWAAVLVIFFLLFTSESALSVNQSINNTLESLTDIMHNIQVDVHHIADKQ